METGEGLMCSGGTCPCFFMKQENREDLWSEEAGSSAGEALLSPKPHRVNPVSSPGARKVHHDFVTGVGEDRGGGVFLSALLFFQTF